MNKEEQKKTNQDSAIFTFENQLLVVLNRIAEALEAVVWAPEGVLMQSAKKDFDNLVMEQNKD